jgi:chondroitin AC lyase
MPSNELALRRLSQIGGWLSISLFAVFVGAAESRDVDADLQLIHDRLIEMSLQGDIDVKAVRGSMESQQADGSWADVNYEDTALTRWQPHTHMYRLLDMARAYCRADSPLKGDEKLKSAVFAAFDYWMKKDPRGRNWFHNQIGVPRQMFRVLFVLEPELSPERMAAGIRILERAAIRGTGANLVWLAQINAARACLIGDAQLCAKAFNAIAAEIRVSRKEGVQPDMSFHQHGAQLYNGAYGMSFATDSARFARLLHGTRFAFPQEKVDLLSRYILDGQQWMFRGIYMDYSVFGRAITQTDISASGMLAGCEDMAALDTPDRAKFLAFARALKGEAEPGSTIVGNKHFWRSEYMTHRRAAYNASVRVPSTRVKRTEVVIGENLKGDHLSDGLTFIYRRGDEYVNIFPFWDWRKLPGTTCLQGDRPFAPGGFGKKSFAGGVSDGTYGCAACDFENDGVMAKKAWFYFDREFVCLGAGIACAAEDAVVTSMNQCLLKGEVTARDAGGITTMAKGNRAIEGGRWAHHDGVGYVFRGDPAVRLECATRKGTWQNISRFHRPDEVSGEVFCLWIDHGRKPAAKSYEYIVVPGIAAGEMDRYLEQSPIEVVGNTPEMQAVRHRGLGITQVTFYRPGGLSAGPLSIASDRACLLMVRELGDGVRLAVSNPENQPLDVNFELGRKLSGEGCKWDAERGVTRVHITLPDGDAAGSSIVRNLTKCLESYSTAPSARSPAGRPRAGIPTDRR